MSDHEVPGGTPATNSPGDGLPSGVIFTNGSDEYADATSPDNSSFAQQPRTVVRPRSAQEVAAAVRAARDAGRRLVVQATGHGAAAPVGDDVELLDTSALQWVQVDPAARTARIGAGTRWAQVQAEAERHGLLGLAGTSPSVGVVGYLVNGGLGWLARPHGLASATLRAVEFVDGLGEVRRTDDANADPDALWSFRGGAPVGIATEVEIDLVPVAELWAGYLLWPAEHLPKLAAAWLDRVRAAPPGLTSTLALLRLPPAGPFPDELLGTVVVHLSCASVDGEAGLSALHAAMREVAEPAVDTVAAADAATLAGVHLDPPAAVPGRGAGWWLEPLDADTLVAAFGAAGVGADGGLNMIELRHVDPAAPTSVDGALTRVPAPFLVHAVGGGPDDAARRATDERLAAVQAAMSGVSTGRAAPAFRDGQPEVGAAYPPDELDRLLAVTRRHDPDGVLAFQRVATEGSAVPAAD